MATPPPPPGFVLEQDEPPPPPPGFVLEAPNRPQSARFTGALAQGLSFAAADEATSALFAGTVGTGKGVVNAIRERDIGEIPRAIGNEFLELQKFQRGERDAFRRERPAIALGAEVAGGLATGGVGVLKAAGPLAAAGTGAIQGGLYGVGAAEGNLLERADDGAKGAAFGAAAGAAFQQVASKVSRFWTARAGKTLAAPDEKRAFELLTNSLAEDLGGRSKAEAALRIWMKNGAKPEELFDLGGPVTQNLYREIASRKPTPALQFINRLKDAQADDIRLQTGGRLNEGGRTVAATREALKEVREQQAGPLFEAVRQQRVFSSEIDDLIAERPALKDAVRRAARFVKDRGNAAAINVERTAADDLLDQVAQFRSTAQPKKQESLSSFVVKMGGIADDRGDIMARIGGTVRGRPGLINKGGRKLDDIALAAQEAGYFPSRPDSYGDRISVNDLIDALSDDLSGRRVFSAGSEDALANEASRRQAEAFFSKNGIDPNAPRDELIAQIEQMTGARVTPASAPSMETLMRAKGVLDDQIGSLLKNGNRQRAADLISVKNELVARLDELAPDYKEARKIFAGTAEVEDAMKKAKEFLRPQKTASDVARDLKAMGQSEREFYKVAVAEEFEALIDRTRDSSNKAAFIATRNMRDKLKALFADNPEEARDLIKLVQKAENRFRRLNEIAPNAGSQTEPRLRARELFEQATRSKTGRAAEAMIDDPLRSLPRKAVRETSRVMSGNRADKVSDVLAQALFEGVPFKPGVVRQPPVQIPYSPAPALAPLTQNRE